MASADRMPRQASREAVAAIRGFEYQHLAGLELWLGLSPTDALFIEWTEDLGTAGNSGENAYQVRNTRHKVSLRYQKVRDLLLEAWRRPPTIQTVLVTTSKVGKERGRGQPGDLPGIAYWREVQAGRADAQLLREYLEADPKLAGELKSGLKGASPDEFEAFVRRVRWVTDAPDIDAVRRRATAAVQDRLRHMHKVMGSAHAAGMIVPVLIDRIASASIRSDAAHRVLDLLALDREIEAWLASQKIVQELQSGNATGPVAEPSVESLKSAVDSGVHEQLAAIQAKRRQGSERGALEHLHRLRDDKTLWDAVSAQTKVAVLRLMARVLLDLDEAEVAQELAGQADALGAERDIRLEAAIAADFDGPAAALALIPSPKTDAERVSRAAFLLRSGDFDAALECLPEKGPDAAGLRILATCLTAGPEAALLVVAAAEQHYPHDISVLRASAFASYVAGHSRAATIFPGAWPQPVDDLAVSESDEARSHFSMAAQRYRRCRDASDDETTRLDAAAWELACRMNLAGSEPEIEQLAAYLAEASPPHPAVVHWLIGRGLPLELEPLAHRIEAGLRAGLGGPDHVLALALARRALGERQAPLSVLNTHKLLFRTEGERSVYEAWTSRWRGKATTGLVSDPKEDLTEALRCAKETENWDEIARFAAEPDTDVILRASLLEQLGVAGRWPDVYAARALLVEQVRTARSVRLWVYSAAQIADWPSVVEVLTCGAEVFPQQCPPLDVRRMKARALARVGDWPAAILEAQTILAETKSLFDAVRLAETYGDVGRLRDAANLLAQRNDLSRLAPETLYRWAARLSHEAPAVAGILLDQLAGRELAPPLIPAAFIAALEVEKGSDVAAKLARQLPLAHAKPEESGLRSASMDELRADLIARRDRATERQGMYERAAAPLHLLFEGRLGLAFTALLNPSDEPPALDLFTRSGGRGEVEEITFKNLALDITGMITAWGAQVYPAVLGAFEGVYVPNTLPLALQYLEKEARPSQPDIVAASRAALNAIRTGAVSEGFAPGEAKSRQVLWGPEEDDSPTGTRLTHLVDWLEGCGHLSAEGATAVRRRLDKSKPDSPQVPLSAGDVLVLQAGMLENLAQTELLHLILPHFVLEVPEGERHRLESEVETYDHRTKTADALRALREQVATDLLGGSLRVLSQGKTTEPTDEDEVSGDRDPVCTQLEELLGAEYPEESAVWIEDRRLSAFRSANGATIVGAPEVLSALVARDAVSPDVQDDALQRLRSAGYRLIPLSLDELTGALRAAPITDGKVHETSRLRAIRRSVAGDLAALKHLQISVPPRDDPSCESAALSRLHSLVIRMITGIWQEDCDVETKKAWSRWVWKSLAPDGLDPPAHLNMKPSVERTLSVGRHARLTTAVIMAQPVSHQSAAAEWLWHEIYLPTQRVDPTFWTEVVAEVRREFLAFSKSANEDDDTEDEDGRGLIAALTRRAIVSLPESLISQVLVSELREAFDLPRPGGQMTLGGVEVDGDAFVASASEALIEGAAPVSVSDGRVGVIHNRPGGSALEVGGREHPFDDWVLRLASDKPAVWRAAVADVLGQLEASPQLRNATLALCRTEDILGRIATVHDAIAKTVGQRAQYIAEGMRDGSPFLANDLLPPAPSEIAQWLGMTRRKAMAAGLRDTIKKHGPLEAVVRFGALSPLVHDAWILAVDAVAEKDVPAVRDHLCSSPVGALGAVLIAARRTPESFSEYAEQSAIWWQEQGLTWARLATWIAGVVARSPEWSDESPDLREAVVWYWSDRLAQLLVRANINGAAVVDQLHGMTAEVRDIVLRESTPSFTAHLDDLHLRVFANGLSAALTERGADALPSELKEAACETLRGPGEQLFPHLSLMATLDSLAGPERLRSMPRPLLSQLFEGVPWGGFDAIASEIEGVVVALEGDFLDERGSLLQLVGRFALSGEQTLRVIASMAAQAATRSPLETREAAKTLAPLVRNPTLEGAAWRDGSNDLLSFVRAALADPPALERDQERLARAMFEIGWAATLGLPEQERADAAAKWALDLSTGQTRSTVRAVRGLMERLLETTPFEFRADLWKAVRTLRKIG